MDNIKRIFFAILTFMGMVSLHSCSDDSIITDADNQTEEQTHTVTMKLSGGLRDFDLSRAEDFEWNDGDRIYLVFTSGNSTVNGTANYDARNDAWSVTYTGVLPQGASAKCEAYYFDGAGEESGLMLDKVVTDKWRELYHTTAIYADKNAAYIAENGVIAVFAILTPATGRIRFRGEPGTVFTVIDINYYNKYDIFKNTLYSSANSIFTSKIGEDGHSPYFYGYFSDESKKEMTICSDDGLFTSTLSDNALSIGHSGCLTLPTIDSHSGWNYENGPIIMAVNGVQFKMIKVEAGTFTMGATPEQTEAWNNEKPAHQVTLTKDYYMGETEVTQALWYAVMGQKPTADGSQWYASRGLGDNYPAYYISWNDCQEFITKLNQLTGLTFRLPTEAEWEYAARGGNKATTQTLYSGSNTIDDVAWNSKNSSNSTHEVARKAANALGLYDMSGNVLEWCYDRYVTYSSDAQTDPIGLVCGDKRIARGGNYWCYNGYCSVASRFAYTEDYVFLSDGGMRLVLGDPIIEPEPEPIPEPEPDPNDRFFTANGVTFKMKLVKSGTFTMGATSEQTGAEDDEKPAHQVTLTKDYYIGETEVTQALWYAVMGQKPTSDGDQWSSEEGLGDNYPAYYISWNDCQEFITKLNQLTGRKFRLPTEAEWEYAARGGHKKPTQTLYSGSNAIDYVAWYWENSKSTHIVGTKAANALGLYDMSGNLSEWCNDWFGSYDSGAQTDPKGPLSGDKRVLRKGDYFNGAEWCRVSYRSGYYTMDERHSIFGMRLALTAE